MDRAPDIVAGQKETVADDAPITVRVLGEPIRLRGGGSEEVEALARFVDEKLAEIRSRNEGLPLRSLLILTSLNIAEDLFRERREHERILRNVEERTRRLRENLEEQCIAPVREGSHLPHASA